MRGFNSLSLLRRLSARRAALAALAVLLVLPACQSDQEQADGYEGAYDRALARKAYGEALVSIRLATKTDENEPRRWLKLGHLLDLLNHPGEAANAYQHALDLQPTNVEALENLAVLNVRAGRYESAKQFTDTLLLLQPGDLAGLLASGALALHEQRFADAEKFAAQIIAAAPYSEEGYILRAHVLGLTGHAGSAARLLEERQKADPTSREIADELMNIYRQMGDRDGVRRTAIRLMDFYPNDPRYALESVRAYHAMNRDDDAHRILAQLTTRYARNISVMLAVAGLWRDMETHAVATDAIVAAAAKCPPRVRAALADLLTDTGEPGRAAALLAPMASAPVGVATIDMQAAYARALYALGRTPELQRKIDAIVAFDADNPTALLLRARLAYARGDYLKAATDAGVVASDDDTNEEAALLLAQIYAARGNPLMAAKAYADARNTFPDSTNVVRAQTQWLIGQTRLQEAVQTAALYAHSHSGRSDAWLVYRDVCAAAHDSACMAETRDALAAFTS